MNTSPPRQVLTDETPTSMIDLTQAIEFQEPITASCHQIAAREARFVAMVERQSRFVFRVVYALLRNPHDAEDAVQETFLKIYALAPGMPSKTNGRFCPASPGAWHWIS